MSLCNSCTNTYLIYRLRISVLRNRRSRGMKYTIPACSTSSGNCRNNERTQTSADASLLRIMIRMT